MMLNVVSDMGLLAQLSYLPYGEPPIVKNESFNTFIDSGIELNDSNGSERQ